MEDKATKKNNSGQYTRDALDAQKKLADFEQYQKEEPMRKTFNNIKKNKYLDYDRCKELAQEKDRYGNPTDSALNAQSRLKEAEDSLQKKRNIKKATGKVAGKVVSAPVKATGKVLGATGKVAGKVAGAAGNVAKKGTKYYRDLMSDPTNRKMVQDTTKVVAGLIGAVTTRKRIKFTECNDRISSIFGIC